MQIHPEIKVLKTHEIQPDPENPREISKEAFSGLEASLKQFGYVDLLIVNKRNMQIISGHQRFKVIQSQGVDEVPCILVDVDEATQKAMAVSMNNPEITGEWTDAIIPILEKIRQDSPDEYLALRLNELRSDLAEFEKENAGAGKTLPDDIPEKVEPVTKPGDIWILGNHRLMCGSSIKTEDVSRLFKDQPKAKLFATDPPYLVDYTGKDRPGGGKDWTDVYHEIDIKDVRGFFTEIYEVGFNFVEKNSAIYLWHADKRVRIINEILEGMKIRVHQTIIWVKPATIITFSLYPWRHEPCLLAWRQGEKPRLNSKAKWGGKLNTVWEVSLLRSGDPMNPEYYTDIWDLDWDGKKRNVGKLHPTVKPTEVFAIPMRIHTEPGDICYEPFSGSGSQIIAAERLNRRCFAMEIEPHFCDVAVKRWEDFTGMKAILER